MTAPATTVDRRPVSTAKPIEPSGSPGDNRLESRGLLAIGDLLIRYETYWPAPTQWVAMASLGPAIARRLGCRRLLVETGRSEADAVERLARRLRRLRRAAEPSGAASVETEPVGAEQPPLPRFVHPLVPVWPVDDSTVH